MDVFLKIFSLEAWCQVLCMVMLYTLMVKWTHPFFFNKSKVNPIKLTSTMTTAITIPIIAHVESPSWWPAVETKYMQTHYNWNLKKLSIITESTGIVQQRKNKNICKKKGHKLFNFYSGQEFKDASPCVWWGPFQWPSDAQYTNPPQNLKQSASKKQKAQN